jgi:hypothetical protein
MIFRRGWHFGGRTVRAYSVSHPHVSGKALDHSFSGIAPYPELIRQRGFVRCGSIASAWLSVDDFRGRDASYLAPPAQIRTSPIRAYGSHLGCVTARRDILTKFRLCFSACDTVPRYCARPVLC